MAAGNTTLNMFNPTGSFSVVPSGAACPEPAF
jgi:hypothetical protein